MCVALASMVACSGDAPSGVAELLPETVQVPGFVAVDSMTQSGLAMEEGDGEGALGIFGYTVVWFSGTKLEGEAGTAFFGSRASQVTTASAGDKSDTFVANHFFVVPMGGSLTKEFFLETGVSCGQIGNANTTHSAELAFGAGSPLMSQSITTLANPARQTACPRKTSSSEVTGGGSGSPGGTGFDGGGERYYLCTYMNEWDEYGNLLSKTLLYCSLIEET